VRRLEAKGYRALDERESWTLASGDKVHVVRGGSTIAAFELGSTVPSQSGFRFIGAHTDSPNLRVKPLADLAAHGAHQIAVEPYGGVLLHTWLDRDLALAGRVLVRSHPGGTGQRVPPRSHPGGTVPPRSHPGGTGQRVPPDGIRPELVRFDRALARVPSLAIHLDRTVNEEGLKLNAQSHMVPMWGLESGGDLSLGAMLADALSAKSDDILGYDLCFYDAVPPTRSGARGELIFAPRLDNLGSCHAALSALLSCDAPASHTRAIVLYDHEECGSKSAHGADSPFLSDVLARIVSAREDAGDAHPRALARSFLISADMAHGVHPNYADKHEPGHRPRLGGGPVVKTNVNQRYATDGESWACFAEWCERADVAPQHFVTRSDLACGTTIGPLSAARLGIRTVDVGNPMLSMHSCREMAAAADVAPMIAVMRAFFSDED
jgi:aspartyl aminopeptidase